MAGMLPGVESARRRRFHQSSGSPSTMIGHGYSRRPAYCLYTTNHESHIISASSLQKRSGLNRASHDEKLGQLAREAKERLDERLGTQRKTEIRRNHSDLSEEIMKYMNGRTVAVRELQTEVFGTNKSSGGSKRFSWAKLGWKPWEQEECAVCLEQFRVGENLVNLPCAHKFHSRCLVPWLEKNAYCPCCRVAIFSEN
ncbi:hypothetical protein Ancab_006760 [Ancistrocladus abbreviatus]